MTPALKLNQNYSDKTSPQDEAVIEDICKTLSVKGKKIEICEAAIGGSEFNLSNPYDVITPEQYKDLILKDKNLTFGNCREQTWLCDKTKNGGRGKQEHVSEKNLISFDADFTDYFSKLSNITKDEAKQKLARMSWEEKKALATKLFSQHKDALEAKVGPVWLAVYSGNGFHFHLKLSSLLPIDKDYKEKYKALREDLETEVFKGKVPLDKSLSDTAKLLRLPLSTNWKNPQQPLKTEILHHNSQADSAGHIKALFQTYTGSRLAQEKAVAFKGHSSNDPELTEHIRRIENALTFQNHLFDYYGYAKQSSIKRIGNEFLCSSPFREPDNNPSFSFNEDKKVFHDKGDTNFAGNVFHFIAFKEGLGTKGEDFFRVLEIAEKITGISRPASKQKQQRPAAKKKLTYGHYKAFFENLCPEVRRDILTATPMIKVGKDWESLLNRKGIIISHALDADLVKSHVENHLERWAEEKPLALLIDIPKWDGVERIKLFANALHVTNVSPTTVLELIKAWGANAFRKLNNPATDQKCLILKGPQGAGKDTWSNYLLAGFGKYFRDMTISKDEEQNDNFLIHHVVVRISEFERASQFHVATLKNMITRPEITFTRKYKKDPESFPARYSLLATANIDQLLKDHTGNRRYWLFELEDKHPIDWNYPQNASLQVLAEFKHLAEVVNFQPSESSLAEMKAYIAEETPEDPNQAILEAFDEALRELEIQYGKKRFEQKDLLHLFKELAQTFGTKGINPILGLLKANKRKHRFSEGWKYMRPEYNPSISASTEELPF